MLPRRSVSDDGGSGHTKPVNNPERLAPRRGRHRSSELPQDLRRPPRTVFEHHARKLHLPLRRAQFESQPAAA